MGHPGGDSFVNGSIIKATAGLRSSGYDDGIRMRMCLVLLKAAGDKSEGEEMGIYTSGASGESLKVVTIHDGVTSVMMVSCRPDEDVIYWFGGGVNDDRSPNVEFIINHHKNGYGITHNFVPDENFSWRSEQYETTKFWTDKHIDEKIDG
ncbi:hypothetical protein LCGC14_0344250 [marine sediment metagenome]|uniref:Uncharacterized protein n=1 Tax=marine sediment metagenome TaxID=412755 RepID=A0A0F9TI90_9ZZZZ